MGSVVLSGCANRILLDRIEGRTSMPCPRIADIEADRPGALTLGAGVAIRKPTEFELKSPSEDSLVEGRQAWTLPGWSVGGHLAWTLLEGVTIVPEGFLAGRGGDLSGDLGATLGLHAQAGWVAWQLEGRIGASWMRSRATWRTWVDEVGSSAWLDTTRVKSREGMVPWLQAGLQIQSAFPRQSAQLWGLGRWGIRDPALLQDDEHEAILPRGLMDWQLGCGVHRRFGRRDVATIGVLHEIHGPLDMTSGAATTSFVVQWEHVLRSGRTGSD